MWLHRDHKEGTVGAKGDAVGSHGGGQNNGNCLGLGGEAVLRNFIPLFFRVCHPLYQLVACYYWTLRRCWYSGEIREWEEGNASFHLQRKPTHHSPINSERLWMPEHQLCHHPHSYPVPSHLPTTPLRFRTSFSLSLLALRLCFWVPPWDKDGSSFHSTIGILNT